MTEHRVRSAQLLLGARVTAAVLLAVLLTSIATRAEADDGSVAIPARDLDSVSSGTAFDVAGLRQVAIVLRDGQNLRSLATLERDRDMVPRWKPAPGFQASLGSRQRSTRRKVIGGIVGGVGGFFGGAFLGAAIEGDRCDCDDPGFVGFWIGAPVGAVVGAIVGVKFF